MSEQDPPRRPAARRRLHIALALLVALVLGVRAALPLVARRAIGWAAERALGLEAGAEDVDFRLWRGRVTVEGLWIRPPGANAAAAGRGLTAERLHLDLALRKLPFRQLWLTRARIEGLAARVERGADGRIDLLSGIAAGIATAPETAVAPALAATAEEQPPAADSGVVDDVTWTLLIDSFELRRADLRLRDADDGAELAGLAIDELDLDKLVLEEGPARLGGLALRGARLQTTRAFALAATSSGRTDDEPPSQDGLQIGLVSIENAALRLTEGERSLEVGLELRARDVDLGAGKPFSARLVAEVGDGRIELEGDAEFSPVTFRGTALGRALPVPEIALLAGADAAARARSGRASFDATLRVNTDGMDLQGHATLDELEWADRYASTSRVGWTRLQADISEASIPLGDPARAASLRLALLRVVDPRVTYTKEPHAEAGLGDPASGASSRTRIAIERVEITGGEFEITDRTVSPTYQTQLRELELTALDVDPLAPGAGEFELAALQNGGSRLTAKGALAPGRGSVEVSVERLALPPINAYSNGIGLNVRQGAVSLDSKVRVEDSRWEVDSDVILHRLRLDREQSQAFLDQLNLPFELVLALLRDAKGDVRLPVPLVFEQGHTQTPFTEILLGALRQALLAAAGAPLRTGGFLISLAGGEVSLKPLPAVPGRVKLEPAAIERAALLAEMLEARRDLVLGVAGRSGPADRDALAQEALLERVVGSEELSSVPGEPLDLATRRRLEEALRRRAEGREAKLEVTDEELLTQLLATMGVSDARLAELAAARAVRAREVLLASGRVDPQRVVLREPAPPGDPGVVLDMQRADAESPTETSTP